MGKSSSAPQTTTQNTAPWVDQQPFLKFGFEQAQDQYLNQRPSYYPGSTVAPVGSTTQQGWDSLLKAAYAGTPATNSTLDMLKRTADGGYINPGSAAFSGFSTGSNFPSLVLGQTASGGMLGSNPQLDAMADQAGRKIVEQYQTAVAPGIDSSFVAGGRYGSGQHALAKGQAQDALAKGLSDAATRLYFGNYEAERDRQIGAAGTLGQMMLGGAQGLSGNAQAEREMQVRAAGLVPSLEQARYLPGQILSGVGAEQDAQAQAQINDQINRWNFDQQLPSNLLAQYMQMVMGNYGGTGTMTAPGASTNRTAGMLGGALGGAGLGYSLAPALSMTGPWGAAAGAGIGLLSSLF